MCGAAHAQHFSTLYRGPAWHNRQETETIGRQTVTHKTQNCKCKNPTELTVGLELASASTKSQSQHKEKQRYFYHLAINKRNLKIKHKTPFTKRSKMSTAREQSDERCVLVGNLQPAGESQSPAPHIGEAPAPSRVCLLYGPQPVQP